MVDGIQPGVCSLVFLKLCVSVWERWKSCHWPIWVVFSQGALHISCKSQQTLKAKWAQYLGLFRQRYVAFAFSEMHWFGHIRRLELQHAEEHADSFEAIECGNGFSVARAAGSGLPWSANSRREPFLHHFSFHVHRHQSSSLPFPPVSRANTSEAGLSFSHSFHSRSLSLPLPLPLHLLQCVWWGMWPCCVVFPESRCCVFTACSESDVWIRCCVMRS